MDDIKINISGEELYKRIRKKMPPPKKVFEDRKRSEKIKWARKKKKYIDDYEEY